MESISTDTLDSGGVKGNYVEHSSLVFEGPSLKLNIEPVGQRCSVKKVCLKFRKIHRKKPVPETLFKSGPSFFLCVNFAKFLRTPFS